jgi:signal transduction histidine kinase
LHTRRLYLFKIVNGNKLIISDNGIGFDLDKVKNKIFGHIKKFTDNIDSHGIGLFSLQSYYQSEAK